jgi:hypothetical protein
LLVPGGKVTEKRSIVDFRESIFFGKASNIKIGCEHKPV